MPTEMNPSKSNLLEVSTSQDSISVSLNEASIGTNEDSDEGIYVLPPNVRPQQVTGIYWYKASFLTMNAALGAGLLNFPYAFMQSGGIASGNIIHLMFVSFAFGSLVILAECAAKKQCSTYQEVVRDFCGQKWSLLTSFFISLYCFITCITFIIIIGDQFDRVFASYIGPSFCYKWYLNRAFTMTSTSLLLIWPSCFKRMDGFQFMSYVGVASIFYLMAVVAIEMTTDSYPKGEVNIWDLHPLKMSLVIPTVSFGYQCHVSSIPIFACLKQKDEKTFLKACAAAIFMCIVVYTVAANCGYLTFGSLVTPDVLLSYNARKPYVLAAILLLALKSWTTYPILLFCAREALNDCYLHFVPNSSQDEHSQNTRRKVLAISLCIGTILFAVFIPNIDVAVKLLGCLASVFIFVFPGLCLLYLKVDGPKTIRNKILLFIASLYLILGVFIFGLSLALGVEDVIEPSDDAQPICY